MKYSEHSSLRLNTFIENNTCMYVKKGNNILPPTNVEKNDEIWHKDLKFLYALHTVDYGFINHLLLSVNLIAPQTVRIGVCRASRWIADCSR